MGQRTMLLTAHTGRESALHKARLVAKQLNAAGIVVRALADEAADIGTGDIKEQVAPGPDAAAGAEIVIVLGGDGTLLRAAELSRPAGVPLIGVNLGHVGFLAEAEPDVLADTVDRLIARRYVVEERMTIDVTVRTNGPVGTAGPARTVLARTWALNEATVEKAARERMLEVICEVDGRPLSRLGCDGVVCSTPTGSTAYAYSAGGPVVWPEVEALLLVPISAHALFAPPLVVSPSAVLAVEVISATPGGVLWCDGRRKVDLPTGSRVEVRRGELPVRLVRLDGPGPRGGRFTDRLVAKFGLNVAGWRGRPLEEAAGEHA